MMYGRSALRRQHTQQGANRFRQLVRHELRRQGKVLWTKNEVGGKPDSLGVCLAKISRVIVVLLCMGAFTFFIYRFFALYLQYPTVVDVSIQFPEHPNLPAITVCNNNILKNSKYCNGAPTHCEQLNKFANWTILLHRSVANMDIATLRSMTTDGEFPNCTIRNSTNDRTVSICKNATWIFYERKTCYVMNWMWSSIPYQGITPDDNEFSFVFDLQPDEYIPSNQTAAAEIYIHSSEGIPDQRAAHFTARGSHTYKVSIMTTTVISLPPPYATGCQNYSLSVANDNTTYIGQAACLSHCKKRMAMRLCKCIPGCLLIEDKQDHQLQNITKCIKSLKEQRKCCRTIAENQQRCEQRCPIRCTATYYDILTDEENTFSFVNDETDENYTSDVAPTDMKRYTEINLNLIVVRNTVYKHNARYEPIEILGYVGGYLGIWLGISIPILYQNLLTLLMYLHRVFKNKHRLIFPQNRTNWPLFIRSTKNSYDSGRNRAVPPPPSVIITDSRNSATQTNLGA